MHILNEISIKHMIAIFSFKNGDIGYNGKNGRFIFAPKYRIQMTNLQYMLVLTYLTIFKQVKIFKCTSHKACKSPLYPFWLQA